jgi:hypothetical protein
MLAKDPGLGGSSASKQRYEMLHDIAKLKGFTRFSAYLDPNAPPPQPDPLKVRELDIKDKTADRSAHGRRPDQAAADNRLFAAISPSCSRAPQDGLHLTLSITTAPTTARTPRQPPHPTWVRSSSTSNGRRSRPPSAQRLTMLQLRPSAEGTCALMYPQLIAASQRLAPVLARLAQEYAKAPSPTRFWQSSRGHWPLHAPVPLPDHWRPRGPAPAPTGPQCPSRADLAPRWRASADQHVYRRPCSSGSPQAAPADAGANADERP